MKEQSKTVVIYARYSSDKQNEQSIEGQLSVINSFAERNGYSIIDTYIDRALSGRSDDRQSFQKMIEDSKKKTFEYVIVYKLDRFSRDRYDSAVYKRKLRNNGVKVISATENITDAPEGVIMESVIEGYAEYYSKELSQKVKRGNRESRKKGLFTGGFVPYGYEIVDKRYLINEKEAEVVRGIYKDVLSGRMLKDIADGLNERCIPWKDSKWDITKISRVLRNEKYIGIVRVNGEEFSNICPAIINKETFDRAKKACDRRKHENHSKNPDCLYLLSGRTHCERCGEPMTGKSGKSGRYAYYVCNGKKAHRCSLPNFRKDYLEDIVCKAAEEYVLGKDLDKYARIMCDCYNSDAGNRNEIAMLENKLTDIEERISNSISVIQRGYDSPSLKESLERLEEEKTTAQNQILRLKASSPSTISYEETRAFLETIKNQKRDNKNYKALVINMLIKLVYVCEDSIRIVFYPGDDINVKSKPDTAELQKEISSYESINYQKCPAMTFGPPNVSRTL